MIFYQQGQLDSSQALFLDSYPFIKTIPLWSQWAIHYAKLLFKLNRSYSPELKNMLSKMREVFRDMLAQLQLNKEEDKVKYDAD